MKTAILLAVLVAMPGVANASKPVDNYVANLIEARQYGAAEDALNVRLRHTHGDQRTLLNLAFLYQSTDRWNDANALYAQVLAGPDTQVATNGGTVRSAHDIARAALGNGTVTVASR